MPSNHVIDIKDVKVESIYIPVKIKPRGECKVFSQRFISDVESNKVFLFSYGNGKNFTHYEDTIRLLLKYGDVIAYDYPGYGKSLGYTNEKAIYNSGLAVYDYIKENYQYDEIICYGYCLGGSVSIYIAANRDIDGLILQSTFAQICDCIPLIGYKIMNGYFRSIDHISKVKCPVVQYRSKSDIVIPKWSETRLHNAIRSPKEFMYIGGSHTLYQIENETIKKTLEFIHKNRIRA